MKPHHHGTILALDIGTSKLCALAWDVAHNRVTALRTAPNDATIAGLPEGRHEQNPTRVTARIHELLAELLNDSAVDRAAVTSIAITGQVHGAMLVSPRGEPLTNFVTWRDQRTAALVEAANAADPDGAARCGGPLRTGYGGLLLSAWQRERKIPAGAKAISLLDFVALSLVDQLATDTTHAASWGLLDLRTRNWDEPRIAALRIPREILPALKPACAPLGQLRPEVAAKFSLPETVRVHAPVGDNQASVAGVAGFDAGACVLNLGTGGQISLVCPDHATDPRLETRPMPVVGFLQVGACLCGGEAYAILARFLRDTVRELTGTEPTTAEIYERINTAAQRAPDDAGGITADTRFGGTRGEPDARGAFTGIGTSNLTVGNLARAVTTGMIRELAEMIRGPGLPPVRKLYASGNGVRKNPLALPAIEREFGQPCTLSPHTEEAALGAALCVAKISSR